MSGMSTMRSCLMRFLLLNEEFDWRRNKLDKVEPVSGPAEEVKCSEVRK